MAKTKITMKPSIVYKTPERKPYVTIPNAPIRPMLIIHAINSIQTPKWQRKLEFTDEEK